MKKYKVGLYYDGRYYVISVEATDADDAVRRIEQRINTAKEYEVLSIKSAEQEIT